MATKNEAYLRLRGHLQNDLSGWWHPPHCLENFPEDAALRMCDEGRWSLEELSEYYRDVGLSALTETDYAALVSDETRTV